MRIDLNIPEKWESLTDKQLAYFSKLSMEGIPRPEFLTLCLMEFTGLKLLKKHEGEGNFHFSKNGQSFTIDIEMWQTLCNKISWMIDTVGQVRNPSKIGLTRGCNQRFYGVSLEQMLLSDNYYNAYIKTRNIKMLARLTAIFYQLPWQHFKSWKIEKRSGYFLWYKKHMNIVIIWYTGVRMSFLERFPYLFQKSGENGYQSPEEIVLNVLSALNNGDITKNEKLYKSPAIEALKQLNNLAERAAKLNK